MDEIKRQVEEAGEEGRKKRQRAIAMALATVYAFDPAMPVNAPVGYEPPPWRRKPAWNRRSAFRRK
jgi:hypothetical protein